MARYPDIRVDLASPNPFAWVATVRQELRRARIAADEIERFSREALSAAEPEAVLAVCSRWVAVAGGQAARPGTKT